MKKNKFSTFINRVSNLPLWIKEGLYISLQNDLLSSLEVDTLDLNNEYYFLYVVPRLTFAGRQELVNHDKDYPKNLYLFLSMLDKQYNIIEIAIEKVWTLEKVATLFMQCYEEGYIQKLESSVAEATALYLASKIRVGEYLKKIDSINFDQLQTALRIQKEYLAKDTPKVLGEILVELGYVERQDLRNILMLKDESRKEFELNLDFS